MKDLGGETGLHEGTEKIQVGEFCSKFVINNIKVSFLLVLENNSTTARNCFKSCKCIPFLKIAYIPLGSTNSYQINTY